jgi:hypothetical protein
LTGLHTLSNSSGSNIALISLFIGVLSYKRLKITLPGLEMIALTADVKAAASLLADLDELLPVRLKRDGRLKARLWYHRQITSAIISYAWVKVKKLSGVPSLMK